ncbi:hypothetical protein GRI91_07050 [Altererythrobacter endophyticus]|uniref:DUF3617 family protein n=2 Tax=Altericroceibacterium endophyticum TaxID=1808508 RepID=A0A6I4T3M8_9SPHN|nr:hypothetical protein [Altericroceibacterium endophyticum]
MKMRIVGAVALLPAAALLAGASPLANVSLFKKVEHGEWSLRIREGGQDRKVCVRSGEELVQIRHNQPGCNQFVVSDEPNRAIIQYTCRGNGYGRTEIRRERSGLMQLQSQGIHDGVPFSISAEARYTGSC